MLKFCCCVDRVRAVGTGDGGNISISAPVILGLGNSDIIANAVQGRGGNIDITTQGIFGLKYRDRLTPESDITASSQFGINGTVQITNPGVDPNSGLIQLPSDLIDKSQQVTQGCSANQGSSFVVTGRGGLPQNPLEEIHGDRVWTDLRIPMQSNTQSAVTSPPATSMPASVLVEATTWRRDANGNVELIAAQPAQPNQIATCASSKAQLSLTSHPVPLQR